MANIVVVAQEREVFEFLVYMLNKEGYEVKLFSDRLDYDQIRVLVPDLVILESGGPTGNVEEACARIRGWLPCSSSRILVIGGESDLMGQPGSVYGADAFLERPLHPRSVVECVKKLLQGKAISPPQAELSVANLVLDPASFRVMRSGRLLSLSVREFRLLFFLASHPNKVWSREDLINLAWADVKVPLRSVDVFIHRLRMQIEESPEKPVHICGVRGHGYSFQIPAQALTTPVPEA
jgi:DNA-binding response OmpR family regulator